MLISKIIDALQKIPSSLALAQALLEKRDYFFTMLPELAQEISSVSFIPGFGPRDLLSDQMLSFEDHYQNVLEPMVKQQRIDIGVRSPFDDRKIRTGSGIIPLVVYDRSHATMQVGCTDYVQHAKDIKLTPVDVVSEEMLQRMLSGAKLHGDPYTYHSAPQTVGIVPLTKEGHTYVGLRGKSDFPGVLCFPAGHMTFNRNLDELDMQGDALEELTTEYGVSRERVLETKLIGMIRNVSLGINCVLYACQTDIPNDYFDSGMWRSAPDAKEFQEIFPLRSKSDVDTLIHEGVLAGKVRKRIYKLHLALDWLTRYHFKE